MDIAAPQFIIPESFTDKNTTIVMFDLGRLEFHNSNATLKEDENFRDADDDGECDLLTQVLENSDIELKEKKE